MMYIIYDTKTSKGLCFIRSYQPNEALLRHTNDIMTITIFVKDSCRKKTYILLISKGNDKILKKQT